MEMPDNSVPIEVKALSIVRDHLASAAQEITQLIEEKMPQEEFKDKSATPIMTKSGLLLAEFTVEPKHARLEAKKDLRWSEELGPCGWLLGQLKKHASEHKGEIFRVEEQVGSLKAIDFPNGLQSASKFVDMFGWTLNRLWEQATSSVPSSEAPQK
jgi:hypothetical protein